MPIAPRQWWDCVPNTPLSVLGCGLAGLAQVLCMLFQLFQVLYLELVSHNHPMPRLLHSACPLFLIPDPWEEGAEYMFPLGLSILQSLFLCTLASMGLCVKSEFLCEGLTDALIYESLRAGLMLFKFKNKV